MTGQIVIGRWVGGAAEPRSAAPELPVPHVERRRLLDRLTVGAAGPLTCISAPAGSGKTTLAADWVRSAWQPRAAWLDIGADDGVAMSFWRGVADALAAVGVNTRDLEYSGDRQFRADLAAAIASEVRPVVLVIDGFDNVRNRRITVGLDQLLRSSGSNLRLVLLTRTEPNLLTARFRIDGRYTEIRGRELAFTVDEAAELLDATSHAVSRTATAALVAKTEGWVTGLRLILASVPWGDGHGTVNPGFGSESRWISDYLIREVLDAKPRAVRDFMMRTSIPRTLPVDLAVTLSGRGDAETVLEDLIAENAFVECVSDQVYRYHPLFVRALRRQLRREHPADIEGLYRAAADLFLDKGLPIEALHHATRSEDWRLVAQLIIDELLLIPVLSGIRVAKVMPAARSIPDQAMWRDERAAAIGAAVATTAMDDLRAAALLQQVDELSTWDPSPGVCLVTAATRLRMAMRRPDGAQDAIRHAGQALDVLTDVHVRPTVGWQRARSLLLAEQALALVSAGQLDRAVSAADTGRDCPEPAVDGRDPLLDAALAFALSLRGDLSRASDLAHATLARTAGDDANERARGYCHLSLAWIQSERAELPAAREELLHARERGMRQDALAATALVLIQKRLKDSLPPKHWPIATGAEPSPASAPGLSAMRAAALLAAGEAHGVERTLDGGLRTVAERVQLARARLALGERAAALDCLRPITDLDAAPALSTVVDAHVVLAHAADETGDTVLAARSLTKALRLARRERIRRPFLEEGRWLRQAVVLLIDNPERYSWLGQAVLGAHPDTSVPQRGPLLTQPLSDREQEVVRKLADMLSTEEIAAEMFLSVNTVKTHLRSIYRKLAASRRGEAVRRARDLGLL